MRSGVGAWDRAGPFRRSSCDHPLSSEPTTAAVAAPFGVPRFIRDDNVSPFKFKGVDRPRASSEC